MTKRRTYAMAAAKRLLEQEPTLKGYAFPSIDEDLLRERLKELVNNGHDTFKIAGIGFCMFERAWTLRGMENLLVDMILNSDFVDELSQYQNIITNLQ